jgi:hypothetical protein
MRNFLLTAFAVGAVGSIGAMPAPAHAWDYPFCLKGDSYESPIGDCSFDSYQQCQATASGRLAYCEPNPYFAYTGKPGGIRPPRPHRRS